MTTNDGSRMGRRGFLGVAAGTGVAALASATAASARPSGAWARASCGRGRASRTA